MTQHTNLDPANATDRATASVSGSPPAPGGNRNLPDGDLQPVAVTPAAHPAPPPPPAQTRRDAATASAVPVAPEISATDPSPVAAGAAPLAGGPTVPSGGAAVHPVPAKGGTPSAWMVAVLVVVLLLLLIAWQIASDRLAPYTARGAVSGYVAQLSSRVAGQVTEVAVQDGAVVQAGDTLAQLDPTPFDLAVRQAEAGLSRALQSNRASATGIVSAQAGVTAARAQRENVLAGNARTMELVARGFLSAVKADDARAAQRSADAQLQQAQAELERAMINSGGREAATNPDIRTAQLQLEQAQLNRRFATVTAPTLGVVTNMRMAVGQYVAPGTPAMTFIDARGAWITADLRENQLGNVQVGDDVGIVFDAVPGTVFKGRVQSIAWGIDVGRASSGGLLQNLPQGQWFEPARHIPIHVELDDGLAHWPSAARIGGKVGVVVYAEGHDNPVAWVASVLLQARAWLSYLY